MTEPNQTDGPGSGSKLGKIRTWWHPLLVRLLDFALSSAFTVQEEVLVGKMPLRVDILLVRREEGQISEIARRELSALLPLLNRFTLIEFKGPTDLLERGDFAQLVGCGYLWHSQQNEILAHNEISLIILTPTVNEALFDEMRRLACGVSQHDPGIYKVTGLPFETWLVETDIMAEMDQPILSLVSHVFLSNRKRIMEELTRTGHEAVLWYMVQQVRQFRSLGEDFAMQHAYSEDIAKVEEELLSKILEQTPAERRVQGLSIEERLAGLSDEDAAARLQEYLDRKRDRRS